MVPAYQAGFGAPNPRNVQTRILNRQEHSPPFANSEPAAAVMISLKLNLQTFIVPRNLT
jgi:hypothetical protein